MVKVVERVLQDDRRIALGKYDSVGTVLVAIDVHPTVGARSALIGVFDFARFGCVCNIPGGEHLIADICCGRSVIKDSNSDGVFDFRRIPSRIATYTAGGEKYKGYKIKKLVKTVHFIFPSFY